jgi:hemin uptake protein HemP
VNREREENHVDEERKESQPAQAGEIRTIDARELLGARGLLHIAHQGETYTLRLTRNNRLILTK